METILKEDGKAIKWRLPIANRHRPLLRDIPHGKINQLESRFIGRKNLLRFNHLPQATIHRFKCLGGINRPTNLRGESKEGDNVRAQ